MTGYDIDEIIGRGAMGVVHRGHHRALDRPVAIKVLRDELAQEQSIVERFLREARLCARLNHPGIVQVYDVVADNHAAPFIVMELLEGESLHGRIKRGPLPEGEAVRLAVDILEALGQAHEKGVIHRDVKPGNVFLCSNGRTKVTDFGIARAAGEASMTSTGLMVGTPQYISPEQAEGQRADARSDLYSVGIVLYEMLTGRAPFQAETPVAILYKQVAEPPPLLPHSISPHLRSVIEKALTKNPDVRYQNAAEFIADLMPRFDIESPTPAPFASGAPTPVPLTAAAGEAAGDDAVPTQTLLAATAVGRTAVREAEPGLPATPAPVVASARAKRSKVLVLAALAAITVAGLLGLAASFWPRTVTRTQTSVVATEYDIDAKPDFNLPFGQKLVQQPGQKGQRRLTVEHTYQANAWGETETGHRVIQEEDVKPPAKEVVLVGAREVVTENQDTALPFTTIEKPARGLPSGARRIVTPGHTGNQHVVWRVTYRNMNGKRQAVARQRLSEQIKPPVTQVVEVGGLRRTVSSDEGPRESAGLRRGRSRFRSSTRRRAGRRSSGGGEGSSLPAPPPPPE